MPSVRISPIHNRLQLEACYDLWAQVFPEERAFFQRRLDYDSTYDYETTWAAYVDGALAAAVQIFPYETAIDSVRLKVGGIGNVATLPQYRGMGLAGTILTAQSDWMRAHGFHVSLLFTGIHAFYERLGWGSATTLHWRVAREHLQRFGGEQSLACRRFQMGDLPALMDIYNKWIEGRTQARIRTLTYWQDALHWLPDDTWVVDNGTGVVAYLRVRVSSTHTMEVTEVCYLPGYEEVSKGLLATALHSHSSVSEVKLTLPLDHAWAVQLTASGIAPQTASPMWKTLDSFRLIRRLRPVLSCRVQQKMTGTEHLLLQCPDAYVLLIAGPTGVDVVAPGTGIEYTEFIRLGAAGLVDMIMNGAPADAPPTVRLLFPKQSGILWPTDYF